VVPLRSTCRPPGAASWRGGAAPKLSKRQSTNHCPTLHPQHAAVVARLPSPSPRSCCTRPLSAVTPQCMHATRRRCATHSLRSGPITARTSKWQSPPAQARTLPCSVLARGCAGEVATTTPALWTSSRLRTHARRWRGRAASSYKLCSSTHARVERPPFVRNRAVGLVLGDT